MGTKEGAEAGYRPSEDPNREEFVHLEASDGTKHLWGTRKIVRPKGLMPYLEKFEIEDPDSCSGRFAKMLETPTTIDFVDIYCWNDDETGQEVMTFVANKEHGIISV